MTHIRILALQQTPVHEWPFQNAAARGGSEIWTLPLLPATVDGLPPGIEVLIALSDLQGVAPHALRGGAVALLGEVLADELALMGEVGDIPHPSHTGILLAGDLFSDPSANHRGASGDVRSVWSAFAAQFRWVTGVAGNHDTFGSPRERERFVQQPGIHLLDGEVRELDGLVLGGVSFIIGRTDKPARREETDQLERIQGCCARSRRSSCCMRALMLPRKSFEVTPPSERPLKHGLDCSWSVGTHTGMCPSSPWRVEPRC